MIAGADTKGCGEQFRVPASRVAGAVFAEAVRPERNGSADPRASCFYARRALELTVDCLERQFGQRPLIFCTNGYEHWMWDDTAYRPRSDRQRQALVLMGAGGRQDPHRHRDGRSADAASMAKRVLFLARAPLVNQAVNAFKAHTCPTPRPVNLVTEKTPTAAFTSRPTRR